MSDYDFGDHVPADFTICGPIKDDDANNAYDILVSQALLESFYKDMDIPYSVLIRMAVRTSYTQKRQKGRIKVYIKKHTLEKSI